MLKRMVLVVVLLAAVTVTPIVNAENARASGFSEYFGYRFTCAPGWCWRGVYDLSGGYSLTGDWYSYGTHKSGLYDLPHSNWYGVFIYDDTTGQWAGACYVYIENF